MHENMLGQVGQAIPARREFNPETHASPHFTWREVACKGSGIIKTQDGYIDELEWLRVACGFAFPVTSFCRSPAHNEKVGGAPTSFHLTENVSYNLATCATDIVRPYGPRLSALMKLGLPRGWSFGINKRFIHMDLRARYTDLPQVVFDY